MIRSNVGNVATNAIQTLSVAGTTAAGMKQANADRRLNNVLSGKNLLSDEDMAAIGEYNYKTQMDRVRNYKSPEQIEQERQQDLEKREAKRKAEKEEVQKERDKRSGYDLLSEDERNIISAAKAGREIESAKATLETNPTAANLFKNLNSPQANFLNERTNNDINYNILIAEAKKAKGKEFKIGDLTLKQVVRDKGKYSEYGEEE